MRDAVDAIASRAPMAVAGRAEPRERCAGAQTSGAEADGKTVWSWHPLLMSSLRRSVGPTGFRQSLIRRWRWQDEFVAEESAL